MGRDRAVSLLADDDVSLLGAGHVHGLRAVRREAVRLAGLDHLFPQRKAVPCGDVDLVRQFAVETDAEHARLQAAHDAFAEGHEREGRVGEIHVRGERLEDLARIGPDHGGGRPLLGHRGAVDLQFRPFGLQPLFQPIEHARGVAGGGGHQETVVCEARGHAVVHHHAVGLAHHAVPAAAYGELGPCVGVDTVEEFRRIGSLDVDLAERGRIHDTGGRAQGLGFTRHGGVNVLARTGEIPRTLPLADVLESRAVRLVPGVHRGLAHRVRQRAAVATRDGAEGDGRERRAERGRADLGDRLADRVRQQGQTDDVGRLALVRRHAVGGVALRVLDRAEAFARCQQDVAFGHVVLVIDEMLAREGFAEQRLHRPQRLEVQLVFRGNRGDGRRGMPKGRQRALCSARAIGERRAKAEPRIEGPRDLHRLDTLVRQEAGECVVVAQLARRLAVKVDRRAETARNEDVVAGNAGHPRPLYRADIDAFHALAAMRAGNHRAAQHLNAGFGGASQQRLTHFGARVDDGRQVARRGLCFKRKGETVVVVHKGDAAAPERDAIARRIGAGCVCQHDARQVVVAENDGALVCAGGENHALGAEMPEALSCNALAPPGPDVIGAPLDRHQVVVVVVPEDRGAIEHEDVRQLRQFFRYAGHPGRAFHAIDLPRPRQQAAAAFGAFLHEDGAHALASRLQRGGQAGRPGTDDDDVAMPVHPVVGVRVGRVGRDAQAGGGPQCRLIELLPEALGPHEGLVIKAGDQDGGGEAVDGADVELDAREAIDARRRQARVKLDFGRAQVRLGVGALLELHQCIRLLVARGKHAARAVILEAACDEVDAIGEQGGSEGVACVALQLPAVEREVQRPHSVDAACADEARIARPRAAHLAPPGGSSPGL